VSFKSLIVGGFVGYVLGAKAGRQRYEQIVGISKKLWKSGPVQQASEKAHDAAGTAFTEAKSKVSDAVKSARHHDDDVSVTAVDF